MTAPTSSQAQLQAVTAATAQLQPNCSLSVPATCGHSSGTLGSRMSPRRGRSPASRSRHIRAGWLAHALHAFCPLPSKALPHACCPTRSQAIGARPAQRFAAWRGAHHQTASLHPQRADAPPHTHGPVQISHRSTPMLYKSTFSEHRPPVMTSGAIPAGAAREGGREVREHGGGAPRRLHGSPCHAGCCCCDPFPYCC